MATQLKKLFVMILAIALSTNLMAQFNLNFGYLRNLKHEGYTMNEDRVSSFDKVAMNGFLLNAGYTLHFADFMGINAGLEYQFHRISNKLQDEDSRTTASINTHTLAIPIRYEVGFNASPDLRFFTFVGPKILIDLSSKYKTKSVVAGRTSEQTIDIYKGGYDYGQSRFNIMFGPGFGAAFRSFTLKVGYDWGVLNRNRARNSSQESIFDDDFAKMKKTDNQFYLTVGYEF